MSHFVGSVHRNNSIGADKHQAVNYCLLRGLSTKPLAPGGISEGRPGAGSSASAFSRGVCVPPGARIGKIRQEMPGEKAGLPWLPQVSLNGGKSTATKTFDFKTNN